MTDSISQILQQFQPIITTIVVATEGDQEAQAHLEEEILPALEERGWQLTEAVRRLWTGERDPNILAADIDPNSRAVLLAILEQLTEPAQHRPGEEPPPVEPVEPQPTPAGHSPPSEAELIAGIRQQWQPAIMAMVAACQGSPQAAAQLDPFLAQLAGQAQWSALATTLERILAGERDPATLLTGLDPTDRLIVSDVLEALDVPVEQPPTGPPTTLDNLLQLADQARSGSLSRQQEAELLATVQAMATDPNAPAQVHALGQALHQLLTGQPEPDLSALPPEVAARLRAMLEE